MSYALLDPLPLMACTGSPDPSSNWQAKSLKKAQRSALAHHEISFTTVLHHPRWSVPIPLTVTRVSWLPETLVSWLKHTAQVTPLQRYSTAGTNKVSRITARSELAPPGMASSSRDYSDSNDNRLSQLQVNEANLANSL